LAARVNKPTLSPNLEVLEQLPGSGIRRLLAIGVGCQVQALRAVQASLPLDQLYVLGLPCVDNVSRAGLQTFLESASASPSTVVHYEFMQDFRIHFRHSDGHSETVPFFGLDTPALKDVFAQLPELLRLRQWRRRPGGGLHGRQLRPPVAHRA
jgi:coenzyme F420 hydrogenase subunit beta